MFRLSSYLTIFIVSSTMRMCLASVLFSFVCVCVILVVGGHTLHALHTHCLIEASFAREWIDENAAVPKVRKNGIRRRRRKGEMVVQRQHSE